ncbi:ribonuclease P protein component [Buchnera aphidicola (Melanaphis sacchari)]|uniref:Ribonuclease P protein component n=1 Tax=Buchnera aphidicola (Melanaphis sacchari) TaxID=2173854 RepID=A0A2U8DG02_9GAMM|nr:ribonuclease P protein component [Buchnera aphidicola]AWH90738.1 ribonuclease P protein component [Buchnera aphidicola (Melanaphis sacchari)]
MVLFFFKKKLRLLKSINFKYVFDNPCIQDACEISILARSNLLEYPRLGLSIPRKNVKYAYKRNAIKRLIRETFRLSQHKLISMDFVVIAKKNIIYLKNKKIINVLENIWSNYHQG